MSDAAALMDRIYASQRHVYDATRKFYLLGRDRLIADLSPPPGGTVLEIGCGTARNLILVAQRYPSVSCYGIDVSRAMLTTARKSVARCGLSSRITLAEADATSFDPAALFGRTTFDRIFVSYALSMIPPWRAVLDHAGPLLAPAGAIHVIDFGDQAGLPRIFKRALLAWLAKFHVAPRETLPFEIGLAARRYDLVNTSQSLFRGYAFYARLARSGLV